MSEFVKVTASSLYIEPKVASRYKLEVFEHSSSQLQVIFVDTVGPTTNLTILVPTLCSDNSGLPHTLEHLIFCGSKSYPQRGYLEALATRSLSTGTNAWTDCDHTAYTFNSIGSQGLLHTLPVFLDHVLNPILSDTDFITEVYHVDGEAKCQGVVYSEMVSREYSEGDLVDLTLKRTLYQKQTTYSYECGGLTPDIAKLTNQQIKLYHRKFYSLDKISVIVAGQDLSREKVFKSLIDSNLLNGSGGKEQMELDTELVIKFPEPIELLNTKTVYFPSEDESSGSVNYAWRGPNYSDHEASLSLEVLLYYLTDSPNSPLQQKFVNLASPLANDVSYNLKLTPETSLYLYFSGVPNQPVANSPSSSKNSVKSMLAPGYFRAKFLAVLTEAIDDMSLHLVQAALIRFRNIQLQGLEDASAEVLTDLVIPAVLAAKLSDTPIHQSIQQLSNSFHTYRKLLEKGIEYWRHLAYTYLLHNAPAEVIAVPNQALGPKLQKQKETLQSQLKSKLGTDELQRIKDELDRIVEENKVDPNKFINLPQPDIVNIPNLLLNQSELNNQSNDGIKLLDSIQLVQTETQFVNLLVGFPTLAITSDLKPYLVLLQAILFQTDLNPLNREDPIIPFTKAVETTNAITLVCDSHLGLGGSTFTIDWLPDLFFLSCKATTQHFNQAAVWTFQNLMKAEFTKQRVQSVAKNLLTELEETFRYGSDLIQAFKHRLSYQGYQSKKSLPRAVSIFQQEEFLTDVVNNLKTDNPANQNFGRIAANLNKLRDSLVMAAQLGGFVQLGLPYTTNESEIKSYTDTVRTSFHQVYQTFQPCFKDTIFESNTLLNSKSIVRPEYEQPKSNLKYPTAAVIQIPALTSSYLTSITPCATFEDLRTGYKVSLLCELLTRSNGPLFELIRGKGLAYHLDLNVNLWRSTLTLTATEAPNPKDVLVEIWRFFNRLERAEEWAKVITETELMLAKASLVYLSATSLESPNSLLHSSLKYHFWGYNTMDYINRYRSLIDQVTVEDLRSVFLTYFTNFLKPELTQTVLLIPRSTIAPNDQPEVEVKEVVGSRSGSSSTNDDGDGSVDGSEGEVEEVNLEDLLLKLNTELDLKFQFELTTLQQF